MQINIGFGVNNDFCQHCSCTMASILVNSDKSDKYSFYIVCEELSDENIEKLNELKKIRDFKINFIKFDAKALEKVTKGSKMNISAFYRLMLFNLEDVDKILYLDSDVIVRNDIKSLYATNISKYALAGAKDIMWQTLKTKYYLSVNSIYINTGVLLINTKQTREVDLLPKILTFYSLYGHYDYGDQDIINYIFQEKILEVDIKYNYCYPYKNEYDLEYYKSVSSNPSIVHYISGTKPWTPGSVCYMKSEYFKYLKYTPFYDEFMPAYQIDENVCIISKLNELLQRPR